MPKFIRLDTIENVAFSECGGIFPVEDYLDEEESPCLPEEAYFVSIMLTPSTFKVVRISRG